MIDSDPLFADAESNDYHIPFTTPCRDADDNTALNLPELISRGSTDRSREHGIGADEFHGRCMALLWLDYDRIKGGKRRPIDQVTG
ncbi:MAG: hypothetical protein ABIK28_15310 [Planctomycetota bacterium]